MQISVTFKKDKIVLPIATSETVQGLIYHALSRDSFYSKQVHDEGNEFLKRKFKLFNFSELKGKYKIENKNIVYISSAELEIRATDIYLIQLLFDYFSKNRFVRLGNNTVEVDDLRLLDEKIFSDRIVLRTLSPITAYITEANGHTVYFSPEDEEFYSAVCANAKRKWLSYGGDERDFALEISPCEGTRFIKRATRFKDTFITAWHGAFVLKGTPRVIDFLYNTGLGSKNSQGFGMFEIIDPNKR